MMKNIYDLQIGIDQLLASDVARFSFASQESKETFGETGPPRPDELGRGEVSLALRLQYLYFAREPKDAPLRYWIPQEKRSRPWPLEVRERSAERDLVTLVIELDGTVTFSGYRLGEGGTWTDASEDLKDPEKRKNLTAPVRGYIRITVRLQTSRLRVQTERDNPSASRDAWCAVLNFEDDQTRDLPSIDVWLDREVYLELPPPSSGGTIAKGLLLFGGLEAFKEEIFKRVKGDNETPGYLSTLYDRRMPRRGLIPLYIGDPSSGTLTPTQLAARTSITFEEQNFELVSTESSCLTLLASIVTSNGDINDYGSIQLPRRSLGIVISHIMLMRGVLLPKLLKALDVSESDFFPGVPLVLRHPVKLPLVEGFDVSLKFLLGFVDEAETIHVVVCVFLDLGFGTVTVWADIRVTIKADKRVVNSEQVLRINPSVSVEILDIRQELAWWAVLASGGLGPLEGPALVLLVKAVIDGKIVNALRELEGREGTFAPTDVPLPGGANFSSPKVSLYQEFADTLVSPLRAHNLEITVEGAPLPQTLAISCVTPDDSDPDQRLDGVGGTLPDGQRWGLLIDDAIDAARAGTHFISVADDGTQAPVRLYEPSSRSPYLQTVPDALPKNNLLSLRVCPGPSRLCDRLMRRFALTNAPLAAVQADIAKAQTEDDSIAIDELKEHKTQIQRERDELRQEMQARGCVPPPTD